MVSKKGALLNKELIELILAAVGIFLLLIVMYNLISPNFDKKDKTSEAYFDSFLEKIDSLLSEGGAEFSFWQPSNSKEEYYLVYFGDKVNIDAGSMKFYSLGSNSNHTCVCHLDKKNEYLCDYCINLNYPLKKSFDEEDLPFVFSEKSILKLRKEADFYSYEIISK